MRHLMICISGWAGTGKALEKGDDSGFKECVTKLQETAHKN